MVTIKTKKMIKKLSLLVSACFLSVVVFAQTEPESNLPESPTKLYRYKLKLAPIKTEEELELFKSNKTCEELIECSVANYKPEAAVSGEYAIKVLSNAESKLELHKGEPSNSTMSAADEHLALKALGVDSAMLEILQNETTNYSALYFGKDTLIGIKKIDMEGYTFYLLRPGYKVKCYTESGGLAQLHSSQGFFSANNNLVQINNFSAKVYKTKMMNKGFATSSLLADGAEVTNLIYLFQYPEERNTFPIQFNLFKYDNKYCFSLNESKVLSSSKAINKRLKRVEGVKMERIGLNEFFQKVGFDY
ncbi:MAG: hypothetical protein RJA07_1191 [Bacteroidota bacterium]